MKVIEPCSLHLMNVHNYKLLTAKWEHTKNKILIAIPGMEVFIIDIHTIEVIISYY